MIKKLNREFIWISLLLYAGIVIISIFILEEDINKVFNFLGAVSETIIVIVLPTMFYILLVNR